MTSHFLPKPSPDASLPDEKGRFGEFGGRFVPETLIAALDQLETEYYQSQKDPAFQAELDVLLRDFVGRPSPLYFAKRLTEHCGGAQIWFKREDLNHTGAHKINSTLGQALLTIRMGKKESLRKLVLASTESRRPRLVHILGYPVLSTWARRISAGNSPMFKA